MYINARALPSLFLALAFFSFPLLSAPSASAAESTSASFRNTRSDVNAGGKRKTSASFRVDGAVGSGAQTTATSASFIERNGLMTAYHYPSRVTDLWGSSTAATTQIYLQWTTPGNDGGETSTPGSYVVRYSSVASESPALSDAKFNAATAVSPAPPVAAPQGSLRSMTVTGLTAGVTYYFAIKTAERDGTRSALSAGATAQTLPPYGCSIVRYVHQTDGPHTSIQAGVDALPSTLPGFSCVIIKDAATYNEQVTVQNFTNNGSSISIFTDPSVGARAVVDPPASSTAGFRIANASVNVMAIDVRADQAVPYGVWASSAYVQLSSVTVSTSGTLGIYTAGVRVSSWSTVSYSTVAVWDAHGFWLDGSTATSVSYSTAVVFGYPRYPIYLQSARNNTFTAVYASNTHTNSSAVGFYANDSDSNTLTNSFIFSRGYAISLDAGSDNNTVRLTISSGVNSAGMLILASDSNTVTQSFLRSNSEGLYVAPGSDYNNISLSTMTGGFTAGMHAFQADFNTFTDNLFMGGSGAYLDSNSDGNVISRSTMIGNARGFIGNNNSSNTVTLSYMQGTSMHGARVSGATGFVMSFSTMVTAAADTASLYLTGSATTTIVGSYVQGSTAAHVFGSSWTVIGNSVFVATGSTGSGLTVWGGGPLSLTTSSLLAPSQGRGLDLRAANNGVLRVSSVTIAGAARGIEISTQAAGFSLSIDSVTFRGLASGATAIHFLGGTFVSTITLANFEDATVGANVSGASLDLASRVTMRSFRGPRAGAEYENDPNGLVDWGAPPTGVALWFVGMSSAGLTYIPNTADGFIVQASTRADFQAGVTVSSSVFGTQDRLAATGLMPNTTYFLRAGALYGDTTVYAQTVITTATLSQLVSGTTVYQINVTSMVVNWLPFAQAPPAPSSMSARGYVLQASTMASFSPLFQTSATANVLLSTLTIDSLRGGVTYYFRVGSLNHNNVPHFAGAVSTLMPVQLGVYMSTHNISVPGLVSMGSTVLITTSVVVTNTGNVKETYWVRATTVSVGSPWRIGATPGANQYALSMLISPTPPVAGDFGVGEDELDDPEKACTASVFAFGGDCVQLPIGATRLLWFKLQTPLVTSTVTTQDIRIFVRAVRDPDPDPNP